MSYAIQTVEPLEANFAILGCIDTIDLDLYVMTLWDLPVYIHQLNCFKQDVTNVLCLKVK